MDGLLVADGFTLVSPFLLPLSIFYFLKTTPPFFKFFDNPSLFDTCVFCAFWKSSVSPMECSVHNYWVFMYKMYMCNYPSMTILTSMFLWAQNLNLCVCASKVMTFGLMQFNLQVHTHVILGTRVLVIVGCGHPGVWSYWGCGHPGVWSSLSPTMSRLLQ